MSITESIKLLKTERSLILKAIEELSHEQLLMIPEGHKNNIVWNLGHIIVTQQVLHYTLSRLEQHISKEMVSMYRTRTSPDTWQSEPDIDELKSLLLSLPAKFEDDFSNGLFKEFRPYKTSAGVELNSFEDAISFNHFHEGTHLGIILSLKKLV